MAFAYNETNNKFVTQTWTSPSTGPGGATGPITVTQDGLIQSSVGHAFELNNGNYTLTVNGQITAFETDSSGIEIGSGPSSGVSKITVGETGNIYGSSIGIRSVQSLSLTNSGTIGGGDAGVIFDGSSAKSFALINKGTIWTSDAAIDDAVQATGNGSKTVTNSGEIKGQLNLNGGIQKITNSITGKIEGNVIASGISGTFSNAGNIAGNVFLNVQNGSVATNSGEIGGYLVFGSSNNKFTNSGRVKGDFDGFGVYFADLNDTMTNSGTIDRGIRLGKGNNSLTNSTAGFIDGDVVGGVGADKVTNAGIISDGSVLLGEGLNNLSNKGTIFGGVTAGAGGDLVTNSGTIHGLVEVGDGADKVTNSGTLRSGLNLGDGLNFLTNSGTIMLGVVGGTNVDNITNSGTIEGAVNTGHGNDLVKNTGQIFGFVDLGAGDDSYTGGKFIDKVYDNVGKDSYVLGAGDDQFVATLQIGGVTVDGPLGDKVDGGTNDVTDFSRFKYGDVYDASSSAEDLQINADTVAHTGADDIYIVSTLAKGTAVGTGIGLDLISNFESFLGGSGNDLIWGNAVANAILGNDGFDHLHGAAGNDFLNGGDLGDELSGDAGADILTGGNGFDAFVYHKLTDSTAGKSGRDIITDFTNGQDFINFGPMPLVGGHLIAGDFTDVAFDGTVGALRILTNNEGWLLQLDSNGDKKVDMSIQVNDVAHSIVWDTADFIF